MSISGGIKFFDENPALLDNGGVVSSISSGSSVANSLIDKLSYTYWKSVGSSDAVQEQITLNFTSTTITRLLLLDHNFKNYTVQYWNGSAWIDFTSVVGLDGALGGGISESNFLDDTSYYEFAAVTTTQLQIKINSTQTANAQKYIATVFPTSELGTFSGYPVVDATTLTRNSKTHQMLSGRVKIVKQPQIFSCTMSFKNYPVLTLGADVDLILSLIDRETPFYMWLSGGRRGAKYFSYSVRTWRLRDCYRVQVDSDFAAQWTANIYSSGQNLQPLLFSEHV